MSINKIDQPGAATPTGNDDYTQQNLLINGNISITNLVLTNWEDTVSVPAIKEGTYFVHSGNLYQTQTADENITGTISNGLNYIAMAVLGTTLIPSYITSLSGYSWNPAYGGLYNGTTLAIPAVVFLSGTNYYRGLSLDKSLSGNIVYAYGGVTFGDAASVSGDIAVGGSCILGGDITIQGNVKDKLTVDGPITQYSQTTPSTLIFDNEYGTNQNNIYAKFAPYMIDGKHYVMSGSIVTSAVGIVSRYEIFIAVRSGSTITFYGTFVTASGSTYIDQGYASVTATDGNTSFMGGHIVLSHMVGS